MNAILQLIFTVILLSLGTLLPAKEKDNPAADKKNEKIEVSVEFCKTIATNYGNGVHHQPLPEECLETILTNAEERAVKVSRNKKVAAFGHENLLYILVKKSDKELEIEKALKEEEKEKARKEKEEEQAKAEEEELSQLDGQEEELGQDVADQESPTQANTEDSELIDTDPELAAKSSENANENGIENSTNGNQSQEPERGLAGTPEHAQNDKKSNRLVKLGIDPGEFNIKIFAGNQTQLNQIQSIALHDKFNEVYVLTGGTIPKVLVFRYTLDGNIAPIRSLFQKEIATKRPLLTGVTALAVDPYQQKLFLLKSTYPAEIRVYKLRADINGKKDKNQTEIQKTIKGYLGGPVDIDVDHSTGDIFVLDQGGDQVLVYDKASENESKPKRILKGTKTKMVGPKAIHLDRKEGILKLSNGNGDILTFDIDSSGNQEPLPEPTATPELPEQLGSEGPVQGELNSQEQSSDETEENNL